MATVHPSIVNEAMSPSIERSGESDRRSPAFAPTDASNICLTSVDEFDALYPAEQVSAVPFIRPLPAQVANGETVSKFMQLCQVFSLASNFTFMEVSKGLFKGRVVFGEHDIETASTFPSKRSAKDELCLRGTAILESLDRPRSTSRSKRKGVDSPRPKSKPGLLDEEWVPILNLYVQRNSLPYPAYQEYEADTRSQQARGLALNSRQYACTVELASEPGHVFGSNSELFYQKADAKRNAAMDAVRWLRANSKLNISPPPKIQDKPKEESQDAMDWTPQQNRGTDAGTLTAAQRVHDLAVRLGFSQPQYHSHPCVGPTGLVAAAFVEMNATFSHQDVSCEPKLRGSLGQTGRVYGKKQAKEECSKEVLRILEEIANHRLC